MPDPLADLDRYLLITSDSHAGSSPEGYGPYLEQKWQANYQDWLKESEQFAQTLRQVMGDHIVGTSRPRRRSRRRRCSGRGRVRGRRGRRSASPCASRRRR